MLAMSPVYSILTALRGARKGPGWQMKVGCDAMPDVAGGEGGHEVAKRPQVHF
jgi:hypothetical protein